MRTSEDYEKAMLKMKPNIWIGDELVGRDDPRIQGGMNIVKENKDGTYDLYQVLNQVGQAEIYSVATDELIEIRKFIAHERDVDDGMDAGDWSGTWYVAWALDFSKLELLDYEWKIPGVYHFRSIAEHGVYTVYEFTVPGVMTYSWI